MSSRFDDSHWLDWLSKRYPAWTDLFLWLHEVSEDALTKGPFEGSLLLLLGCPLLVLGVKDLLDLVQVQIVSGVLTLAL